MAEVAILSGPTFFKMKAGTGYSDAVWPAHLESALIEGSFVVTVFLTGVLMMTISLCKSQGVCTTPHH